jgi:hypothetical protein
MQKKYAICNPATVDGLYRVATLCYETNSKRFRIDIDKQADVSRLPISLKVHAEQGRFELNESFSMDWVRARVCPPNRQNISSILRDIGLSEYDEYGILMYTGGKSVMDDLFLEEFS